jgi:hypothetical protein
MVRHEAAEALGSIATPDVLSALDRFRAQGPRVVRESCEVALDMYEVGLTNLGLVCSRCSYLLVHSAVSV